MEIKKYVGAQKKSKNAYFILLKVPKRNRKKKICFQDEA